jgi:hypothetical protein
MHQSCLSSHICSDSLRYKPLDSHGENLKLAAFRQQHNSRGLLAPAGGNFRISRPLSRPLYMPFSQSPTHFRTPRLLLPTSLDSLLISSAQPLFTIPITLIKAYQGCQLISQGVCLLLANWSDDPTLVLCSSGKKTFVSLISISHLLAECAQQRTPRRRSQPANLARSIQSPCPCLPIFLTIFLSSPSVYSLVYH